MPADIQPSATATPVAVVYDADGGVTDALIGSGASADCFTNGAFGGADAFTTDGHFAHALVILDGKCAKTAASLPDLKYRLVRVLGQVFGMGWSQLNLNAITNSPPPTADDRAGLPGSRCRGVNEVARRVDPDTHQPIGPYAASAVSGFLFSGNAGNLITGFTDTLGQQYNRFGSDDMTLEGFFDLAGLEIPDGSSAVYQISVEALDPNLSQRRPVCSYAGATDRDEAAILRDDHSGRRR